MPESGIADGDSPFQASFDAGTANAFDSRFFDSIELSNVDIHPRLCSSGLIPDKRVAKGFAIGLICIDGEDFSNAYFGIRLGEHAMDRRLRRPFIQHT